MTMQILAGRFRHRRLLSPPGSVSRPTLSRVRQALFNVLAPRMFASRFLDLYAGAGSVGLEAYSQGSQRVVLVESDRRILAILRQNALALDPTGQEVQVLPADAATAVRQLEARGERFEFIYLDPPYRSGVFAAWAGTADWAHLLAPHGWVICQHERRDPLPATWAGCRLVREKAYGRTALAFYACDAPDA